MNFEFPKTVIITGHYGCGKTNVSANVALHLARSGKKVTVVDLDIVNPYFRTADFGNLFKENNIELVVPMYANSNLDIPAISFDLGGIINGEGYTVIDVGGDPEGATALGRYSDIMENHSGSGQLGLYYVINKYRYLTSTPQETVELLEEIKAASRLDCNGIINNSNLGKLTDKKTVNDSMDFAMAVAKAANAPLIFTCSQKKNLVDIENGFETEIYVKPLWEDLC